ncbi:hypothetical protein C8R43DRAFT_1047883 [Mycena crocata]|nr:hypothetical protein C8R43DRAFT_1047883 [Mycena crocata]
MVHYNWLVICIGVFSQFCLVPSASASAPAPAPALEHNSHPRTYVRRPSLDSTRRVMRYVARRRRRRTGVSRVRPLLFKFSYTTSPSSQLIKAQNTKKIETLLPFFFQFQPHRLQTTPPSSTTDQSPCLVALPCQTCLVLPCLTPRPSLPAQTPHPARPAKHPGPGTPSPLCLPAALPSRYQLSLSV